MDRTIAVPGKHKVWREQAGACAHKGTVFPTDLQA